MNTPPDDSLQRGKNSTIATMLGVALVSGVVNVAMNPDFGQQAALTGTQLAANIVLMLLGFRWLHLDSTQLDIRRPLWLNIGIVLLAIFFVPYYLYKTRRPGLRLVPIALFFAFVVAQTIASSIGSGLMLGFRAEPLPAPGI